MTTVLMCDICVYVRHIMLGCHACDCMDEAHDIASLTSHVWHHTPKITGHDRHTCDAHIRGSITPQVHECTDISVSSQGGEIPDGAPCNFLIRHSLDNLN